MRPGTHISPKSKLLSIREYNALKYIVARMEPEIRFSSRVLADLMDIKQYADASKTLSMLVGRDLIETDGDGEAEFTEDTSEWSSKGWLYWLPNYWREKAQYVLTIPPGRTSKYGRTMHELVDPKGKFYTIGLWPARLPEFIVGELEVDINGIPHIRNMIPPIEAFKGKVGKLRIEF